MTGVRICSAGGGGGEYWSEPAAVTALLGQRQRYWNDACSIMSRAMAEYRDLYSWERTVLDDLLTKIDRLDQLIAALREPERTGIRLEVVMDHA